MNALVVTSRHDLWQGLSPDFAARSFSLAMVSSVEEALSTLRNTPPLLVILDPEPQREKETKGEYIFRIREGLVAILRVNAMVHTAVVCDLSDENFHQALEGYGVLFRFPPVPTSTDVELLSDALKQVTFAAATLPAKNNASG